MFSYSPAQPPRTICSTKFPADKFHHRTARSSLIPSPDRMLHLPSTSSENRRWSRLANPSTRSVAVTAASHTTLPLNLRLPRRVKLPPETDAPEVPPKLEEVAEVGQLAQSADADGGSDDYRNADAVDENSVWSPDEIEVITALFERGPPKRTWRRRDRQLQLPPPPLPKHSLPRMPTPKQHIRWAARAVLASRLPLTAHVRKSPRALVAIAREIAALPADADVSSVLERWSRFLRKGSLSMTIRELGHLGLPERALQVLCWAQKQQSVFFPDDRTLASTVEVLARNGKMRIEGRMHDYLNTASRNVVEAMARGFTRAGKLKLARKVLLFAKDNRRTLDPSIHAKLILAAGRNRRNYDLVTALLYELGKREDFDLRPQDCTAVMKVCIRTGRFEVVERLFNWYKASGRSPTIVMYTTVIHSRYCDEKYREGMAAVWEMEESDMLLDLPAYRVVIRLCIAVDDLARAERYFSRLKEAGFSPTYDIYQNMIRAYAISGRLAKCRKMRKEVEMAGMKLDSETLSLLSKLEEDKAVFS